MNVIHAADFVMQAMFISASAWLVVLCLKRAERKARAALIGILACAVMPWFSAWIPARRVELPRPQVIRMEMPTIREVAMPAAPAPVVQSAGEREETPMAAPRKLDPAKGLFIVWVCGSLAGLAFMLRELWITRRWMRTLVGPDERQSDLLRAAGFHGRDRLLISRDGPGPCVAGFFKPVVVVPAWLLESGREMELGWTLRHELEHLRGHDSRWVLLIRLVRCFQWWNPFAHLLARSWDQSRERVCDLRALRHSEDVPDYGRFLLVVAARNPGRITAASMACGRPATRLRRRIASLLKSGSAKPAPAGAGWSIAVAVLLLGVSVVSAGFGFAGEKVAEAKDDDDLSWLEPKPVMEIKVTAIISPEPLVKNGELLTKDEVKTLLDRSAHTKESNVMNLGRGVIGDDISIVVQKAINRNPSVKDPPWDGKVRTNDFVGWVLHCDSDVLNDVDVGLEIKAAYAFVPGWHLEPLNIPFRPILEATTDPEGFSMRFPLSAPSGEWNHVILKSGECGVRLKSGESASLVLGEVEKGVHATCLIGVESRMPWERRGIPYISNCYLHPVPAWRGDRVQTDEQKKEMEEINGLLDGFVKKVDSLENNRILLKLRVNEEVALKTAADANDRDEANRLLWRIDQIRERMWQNAPQELKVEEAQITWRKINWIGQFLGPEARRRFMESREQYRPSPDKAKNKKGPTKFNNKEQ